MSNNDTTLSIDIKLSPHELGSLLAVASWYGNLEAATLLLEMGADTDSQYCLMDTFPVIFDIGRDYYFDAREAKSPLTSALLRDNLEVFKLLLQKGNVSQEARILTIMEAVRKENGDLDLIESLLEGQPSDLLTQAPDVALYAYRWGNIRVLDILMQHGLNVSSVPRGGKRSILNALLRDRMPRGKLDNIKRVLQDGADINSMCDWDEIVCNDDELLDLVQLLVRAGAPLKLIDVHNLLNRASKTGNFDLLKFMLSLCKRSGE